MAYSSMFSSPVCVLPPPAPPQPYTMNNNGTISNHNTTVDGFHYPVAAAARSAAGTPRSPAQFHLHTPQSACGRKRSRDEAADHLIGEDGSYEPPAALATPDEDWEYGEGMTLFRPNGFAIDASSQTGTWAEEQAADDEQRILQQQLADRPVLRSNKSQRLNSIAAGLSDDVSLPHGVVAASSPPKTAAEPTVDDFTLHLGIGWSRISDDADIQAAARGWARFIENHFPLHQVVVRLQSRGLAGYLVEAAEGFFLFGDDLKQGRLVGVTLDRVFANLKHAPPAFDGADTLTAGSLTPPPVDAAVADQPMAMASGPAEVDMEMN